MSDELMIIRHQSKKKKKNKMMIQFQAVPISIQIQTQIPIFNTNASHSFPFLPTKLHDCAAARRLFTAEALPPQPLRYLRSPYTRELGDSEKEDEQDMVASASAVAAVIRRASTSAVEFVYRIEPAAAGGGGDGGGGTGMVLPSVDFRRLCLEQLALFRRIVHPEALLSVYVRPAGSYVMDQLELRRITFYPVLDNPSDIVILVGNFKVSAGMRTAEAALTNQTAEFLPQLRSVVFPLVKHPFVVGFLVAELPETTVGGTESCFLPSTEQRLNAVNISQSLAMAYVMDQKAMLLQHSSWQNNVRMSSLVEQIRGSLSGIRTLSKMLSIQMKRSEIGFDIIEDILVQGDHIQDILQQLQDAAYLTKTNIMRSNEGKLKEMHVHKNSKPYEPVSLASTSEDSEIPMPPLALTPLQQESIRNPSDVSDVLNDLVGAVKPLAQMQQRFLRISELSRPSKVAVEEPALRQALSNLIEGALLRTRVGGSVEIVCTGAPSGGALIVVDDDGPDMHYMTQMHTLTPFGMDLLSENKVEDNMTWNFVAGLTVAQEILESYGCVVRVISPRISGGGTGEGRGTRVELWLPYYTS